MQPFTNDNHTVLPGGYYGIYNIDNFGDMFDLWVYCGGIWFILVCIALALTVAFLLLLIHDERA